MLIVFEYENKMEVGRKKDTKKYKLISGCLSNSASFFRKFHFMNFSKLLDKIELKRIYQRSFHLKFIKIGAFVLYIYIYTAYN